jgi:hypothetical protein
MMQYEYLFVHPNQIDSQTLLAQQFDEHRGFSLAGPATSANIASANVGDDIFITTSAMTAPKYVCLKFEGSGYKHFERKHKHRENPLAIVARPIGFADFVVEFQSKNPSKKTWKLLASDSGGRSEELSFKDGDNLNAVKVEIREKFMRSPNDGVVIAGLQDVNGRSNALKLLSKSAPKVDVKKKSKVIKRPATQSKLTRWTSK